MTDAYRSYVIRVRRRLEPPQGIHLELEDLLGGGRAAISGAEAVDLADRLRLLAQSGGPADSPVPSEAGRPAAPRDPGSEVPAR